MAGKIVVSFLINGQWHWRAESPIDPKFNRRMTTEELEKIANRAVLAVIETVGSKPEPAAPATPAAAAPVVWPTPKKNLRAQHNR